MKRKQIETICNTCGITFLKDESEVKRNLQIGRNNYCNRSCSGKSLVKNFGNGLRVGKNYKIADEFTGLRDFLRRAKNRKHEINFTLDDLKELWDSQKGICVYSKVNLTLPNYKMKQDYIYTASLDRIDSSKGYVKGNLQFISIAMNYLKHTLSHEEMLSLCSLLKENF